MASHGRPNDTNDPPILKFDLTAGKYEDPRVIEQRERKNHPSGGEQFPILQFDLATGQYVDPAVLAERLQSQQQASEAQLRIPTTIFFDSDDAETIEHKSIILERIGLVHLVGEISISYEDVDFDEAARPATKNPLHKALEEALNHLPPSTLASINLSTIDLTSSFPDSYSIYKPMLLLPHNTFSSSSWKTLLSQHPLDSPTLLPLWSHIATTLHTTHIAINSPIPIQSSTASDQNILRSPSNLTPIYGSFGPAPTPLTLSSPTPTDFSAALWVTATQNGIHQTWAPLYTMFSRGNIREKTRVLTLPTVARDFGAAAASVVDMYAGIGYFAFSYIRAGERVPRGVTKAVAFELNAWSVEGLRRGAQKNGWRCRVFAPGEVDALGAQGGVAEEEFWVFHMSNERAGEVLRKLGRAVPPVRHVNLGLLPSSQAAWEGAVQVLDRQRGGWIHVHENVGAGDVDGRCKEIEAAFQVLVGKKLGGEAAPEMQVEHIERVKMYAPGVVHCVFDIRINGAV
ncbi:S-adenosylmethionine-dependent methyltransferase [Coniothyrium glycines]